MQRLLKISIGIAISSITPILMWFCIGSILDEQIINIFSITYPLQYVYQLIVHIFGTGANIVKEKNNNKDVVNMSFIIGSIIAIIIFTILSINAKSYLSFIGINNKDMIMFTIYSILSLGISSIFYIVMEKLYFENRESMAIKYISYYNILNFVSLVGCSLIVKSQCVITSLSLLIIFLYTLVISIKEEMFHIEKLEIHLFKSVKYESSTILSNIMFMCIFLFGLKNTNNFGFQYIAAINFVALITDTQWDSLDAVTTVAKVDISKGVFNLKKHLKDSYILTLIYVGTSVIMLLSLYQLYDLDFGIVIKIFIVEVINFAVWVKYATERTILQLNNMEILATTINFIGDISRFLLSIALITPYCIAIGQLSSALIQFICYATCSMKYKNIKDFRYS